jgi:hypothetical protein
MPNVLFDVMRIVGVEQQFIVHKCSSEDEVIMHAYKNKFDVQYLEDKDKTTEAKTARRFYIVSSGMLYASATEMDSNGFEICFYQINADRYFSYIRDKAKHVDNIIKERTERNENLNRPGPWSL